MSDLLALNVLRTHGHRRGQKGPTLISSLVVRGVTRMASGAQFPGSRMTVKGAKKSKCHK